MFEFCNIFDTDEMYKDARVDYVNDGYGDVGHGID